MLVALVATLLAAQGACGGLPADAPPGPDPSTVGCFVAYGAQFTAFRAWPSHHVDGGDLGGHATGPRTEYLAPLAMPEGGSSDAAPSSATEFPQGTILVTETEDPANHHVLAMVKRGCDFDPDGARGWEWFELSAGDIGGGKENILWRGTAPPAEKMYADCNGCHATRCAGNDSVCSAIFALASPDSGVKDGGLHD